MIRKIVVHSFSNGKALLDLGPEATSREAEEIRGLWGQDADVLYAGVPVEVVDHPNPLGPDMTFDALSHAFGSLGWEVEDEQIEALIEALRSYEEK